MFAIAQAPLLVAKVLLLAIPLDGGRTLSRYRLSHPADRACLAPAQVVTALFIVPALGQFVARVVAGDTGDIGMEVGGIVSEQVPAYPLLAFPQIQQR